MKTCHIRTPGAQRRLNVLPTDFSASHFNRCLAVLWRLPAQYHSMCALAAHKSKSTTSGGGGGGKKRSYWRLRPASPNPHRHHRCPHPPAQPHTHPQYRRHVLPRAVLLRNLGILGGPQLKGDKIRIAYITPAFLGGQKRAVLLRNPCVLWGPQSKGDKIRIGYITPAFSGAQKRAVLPCNPWHSRQSAIEGGQNQNWLHHPCLLEGPKEGGIAT